MYVVFMCIIHSLTNSHMYCHTTYTHTHNHIHLHHSYILSGTHALAHNYTLTNVPTFICTQLEGESIEVMHVHLLLSCSRGNSWSLDFKPPLLHRSQEHIFLLFEDSYIVQIVSGSLIYCRCYNRVKRTYGPLCYLFWYPCLS